MRSWHQENNNLLDWLDLALLVVLALQHLSWLYVDMPKPSMGAGASQVRKSLAPVFQARSRFQYHCTCTSSVKSFCVWLIFTDKCE